MLKFKGNSSGLFTSNPKGLCSIETGSEFASLAKLFLQNPSQIRLVASQTDDETGAQERSQVLSLCLRSEDATQSVVFRNLPDNCPGIGDTDYEKKLTVVVTDF